MFCYWFFYFIARIFYCLKRTATEVVCKYMLFFTHFFFLPFLQCKLTSSLPNGVAPPCCIISSVSPLIALECMPTENFRLAKLSQQKASSCFTLSLFFLSISLFLALFPHPLSTNPALFFSISLSLYLSLSPFYLSHPLLPLSLSLLPLSPPFLPLSLPFTSLSLPLLPLSLSQSLYCLLFPSHPPSIHLQSVFFLTLFNPSSCSSYISSLAPHMVLCVI